MGTGGIDYWKDGRETRDNTHLLIRYENDVVASFTCLTSNAHDGFEMTFLGSKGTISTSLSEAWVYSENNAEVVTEEIDAVSGATAAAGSADCWRLKPEGADPTQNAIEAFRECIIDNRQPLADVANALEAATTVQLALDAMDDNSVKSFSTRG